MKQGSTSVGLKSNTHVVSGRDWKVDAVSRCVNQSFEQVLVGLKKSPHDLAVHQEKVFEIDTHMGIVISGMTADARFLTKFMRNACLNYSYVYGSKHPCERLIANIAKKA